MGVMLGIITPFVLAAILYGGILLFDKYANKRPTEKTSGDSGLAFLGGIIITIAVIGMFAAFFLSILFDKTPPSEFWHLWAVANEVTIGCTIVLGALGFLICLPMGLDIHR